jgi:hypothetical protein
VNLPAPNVSAHRSEVKTRPVRARDIALWSCVFTDRTGAVVVPATRDFDLDYWVFGLTLSDEEGQG